MYRNVPVKIKIDYCIIILSLSYTMYKKITETFENPTIEEYFEKHNIKGADYINDSFMMGECSNFTKGMIESGMDINKICEIVKNYQKKYIYVKNESPELAKLFTIKMWYICNQNP